jgi:hypothetical protein
VTEYLRRELKSRIQQEAESAGFSALTPTGPGYDGWSLADQGILLSMVEPHGGPALSAPIRALPSGMLLPKLSMLLVFPVSAAVSSDMDVAFPCSVCNYVKCAYRRMAFVGRPELSTEEARKEAR